MNQEKDEQLLPRADTLRMIVGRDGGPYSVHLYYLDDHEAPFARASLAERRFHYVVKCLINSCPMPGCGRMVTIYELSRQGRPRERSLPQADALRISTARGAGPIGAHLDFLDEREAPFARASFTAQMLAHIGRTCVGFSADDLRPVVHVHLREAA